MRLIFFLILFSVLSYSQVVYEPLHRDVYNFLGRLSQKSVIEFNDNIRPLPRKYIAEKLNEASKQIELLTSLEKDELEFFKKDYLFEINFISEVKNDSVYTGFFRKDKVGRLRLFSFNSQLFKLNLSPILGLKIGSRDKTRLSHLWNGISLYGYVEDYIGYSFDFRDNTEAGEKIDKNKDFTPVTGVHERSSNVLANYSENKIEYSEVTANISLSWNWGSFSAGKGFFEMGYGESGLLVLSQKAPSFPYIRLDVSPVDWLSFNYIHGWLASDVIDSSKIYYTGLNNQRLSFRKKFLASHTLTLRPVKGLSVSVGESIVYSDNLELVYLIPLMFFRIADHHLSRQANTAGGNAQFFFGISSKGHLKNTHLYGTLFIDEITLGGLFDPAKQRNQLGFTLGGSISDLPFNNLTLKIEYTKIYPFVYKHFIPTIPYQSASYNLGHWMGHNADQIYLSMNYRILRGLQATLWGQYIRKGEDGTFQQQHEIQPQPPFLFGLRTNYTYAGLIIKYEFLHELFARVEIQSTEISKQQSDLSYVRHRLNEFYLSVYYGL
jgi:hypothetical protein